MPTFFSRLLSRVLALLSLSVAHTAAAAASPQPVFQGWEHQPTNPERHNGFTAHPNGWLYGTSWYGGEGSGLIFRMNAAGTVEQLVSFTYDRASNRGGGPHAPMTVGPDGNLFGTTSTGGAYNCGTIFKMTPEGVLTTLVEFTHNDTLNRGASPTGSLTLGTDGNFYGTTSTGGAFDSGTVFKMTPAGELTTLVDFTQDGDRNRGGTPDGSLTLGGDGHFYGMTATGGANTYGTIFRMTAAGALTTLVDFTFDGASNRGAFPYGSLTLGGDGHFYGMTRDGGATGVGTVFRMTAAGELTTLVEFTENGAGNKGANPLGSLALGDDGNFYGMTSGGGEWGVGTVFRISAAGELTTLVEFTDNGASNKGGLPYGSLTLGGDGHFYGMTYYGGAWNYGTIFKMTASGELTTLLECTGNGYSTQGAEPQGSLTLGPDGHFYGVTSSGGTSAYCGTVFRLTAAGELTKLVDFTYDGDINKGAFPHGALTLGGDGNFYGMTSGGGASGYGTVFRMTPAGDLTTLVELTSNGASNKGAYPYGSLTLGGDGHFYGMTSGGGALNKGTVFRMTPAGELTTLVEFTGNGSSNKGEHPFGSLTLGENGTFYGMTQNGGAWGYGTVFKMTGAGVLTTLVEFTGAGGSSKGLRPKGSLTFGADGNLYGMTDGGSTDHGTTFRMTPAGVLTTLADIGGFGSLTLGIDGNFHGMTRRGGANDFGTVFSMTPEGVLTTALEFTASGGGASAGSHPGFGHFTPDASGNLYGLTSKGAKGFGTVFRLAFPQISLSGNGITIAAGDVTPDVADHTDFGRAAVAGGSVTRTFSIGNEGLAALHLTGTPKVAVSGPAAADFNVTLAPESPVAAAGATSVGITFDPSAPGFRSATVSITSDDPNDGTVSFAIRGIGIVPGTALISFADATVNVMRGATSAELTLVRTEGTAACSAKIQTDDGTLLKVPPFTPALAGTDYHALAGAATTVSFAEGEMTKTVTVTLMPKTPASTPNKRFTATLSNASAGADLGAHPTTTIQILATDTAKPTVTVSAPAAGKISSVLPLRVAGTAGDAKGIDRVTVALNGGAPVQAVLGAASSPTAVPFSLPITPMQGPNVLTVTAYDMRGNSVSVTRNFTFTRRWLLTLSRNDAARGTVTLAAAPAAAATALTPAPPTANPKTSQILPGTTVKLTAAAKKGFVFDRWTGLPGGATVLGDAATFTMPASDAMVAAEFVATPFNPTPGGTNTWYGLIHPEGGAASTNATEGFVTGTLTPSGAFTGKLFLDGATVPFNALFFGQEAVVFTKGTARTAALTFDSRTLVLAFAPGSITATVTNGGTVSVGVATPGIYSSAAKVPAVLLNSTSKGYYTLCLPAAEQMPPLAAGTYPQGDGYASVTVSNSGGVTLAGVLADGTTVTAAGALLTGDVTALFTQLSTPGATASKGGSLSGGLTFNVGETDGDLGGDFLWFRPAAVGLKTPLYTDGWPGGIVLAALGALYDGTLKVQAGLGLPAADPVNGNAELTLSDGKLTSPITKTNFNINGNAVAKIPSGDASFTLTLAGTTGLFSGSFTPNWANPIATKPGFKGLLIQRGTRQGGSGFFLSNAKDDADPEAGRVELRASIPD